MKNWSMDEITKRMSSETFDTYKSSHFDKEDFINDEWELMKKRCDYLETISEEGKVDMSEDLEGHDLFDELLLIRGILSNLGD